MLAGKCASAAYGAHVEPIIANNFLGVNMYPRHVHVLHAKQREIVQEFLDGGRQ